jgi:phage terminase large subunit
VGAEPAGAYRVGLGHGRLTAIWFIQMHNNEASVIDYYEASGEALGHYANVLSAKPYTWGKHIVPHDAQVRELGTGRSRLEILQGLGLEPQSPRLSQTLHDGIEAARLFLKRCWFDADKCKQGIECLQNYRREENTKTGELKTEPVHDWASHGADAFRYAAIGLKESGAKLAPLKYSNHGIY